MYTKSNCPAPAASLAESISELQMLTQVCEILLRVRAETKPTGRRIVRRDQAVEWSA